MKTKKPVDIETWLERGMEGRDQDIPHHREKVPQVLAARGSPVVCRVAPPKVEVGGRAVWLMSPQVRLEEKFRLLRAHTIPRDG